MRWLLIIFTGLALMLSACSKIGSGEKIAVVNWERVLQEHPQYARLQKLKDEYNLLLDKRREQEIVGKTQMSGLARLYQLKRNSKQHFLSAGCICMFKFCRINQLASSESHREGIVRGINRVVVTGYHMEIIAVWQLTFFSIMDDDIFHSR